MLTSQYNMLKKTLSSRVRGHINLWLTLDDSRFTPGMRGTLDIRVFQFNESKNISKFTNTDSHVRQRPHGDNAAHALSEWAIAPGQSCDRHG
jgi:hypothetical protein